MRCVGSVQFGMRFSALVSGSVQRDLLAWAMVDAFRISAPPKASAEGTFAICAMCVIICI